MLPPSVPAVLDLRRADRRGRLDQRGQVLAAERRAPDVGVGRQRAEDERADSSVDAAQLIEPPQVEDALRRLAPSSPVIWTMRSVPPAGIGRRSRASPASAEQRRMASGQASWGDHDAAARRPASCIARAVGRGPSARAPARVAIASMIFV